MVLSHRKQSQNKNRFGLRINIRDSWYTNGVVKEQAILVGTQTVLDDNPKLDVRDWKGNNPVRVVLDRTGKIYIGVPVRKTVPAKTIILTENRNSENFEPIFFENCNFANSLPHTIAEVLYRHEIQSVIVEGGRKTLQTFIDANLWDEAEFLKETSFFPKEHLLRNYRVT